MANTTIPKTSFNTDEDAELVRLLEKVRTDKGRTPSQRSFEALCAARNLPATELVILGPQGILLCVYGDGVQQFAGQWHVPGGYTGLGNLTLEDDCNAVAKRELGIEVRWIRVIDAYKWLHGAEHPHGAPVSIYMHCRPEDDVVETDTRKFFPINQLPANMILPQRRFVEKHAHSLQIWQFEGMP